MLYEMFMYLSVSDLCVEAFVAVQNVHIVSIQTVS